ncbi:MAG: ADOP family duplicated permease [Vicinamibacterales bacterium]|nr:ADOP family duplicated permease [Vicinamibacterales bacterium]
MKALARDVRNGLRQWIRAPLVTAVATASLALGIGVNLAILTLVMAVYFTPLPVPAPDRLARLAVERGDYALQNVVWDHFSREQPIFPRVAGAAPSRVNLASDGESRFVEALYVSGGFFEVIGVPMATGRGLTENDDQPGASPVAVVSHVYWLRNLGGRDDIVGRTVEIGRTPVAIVGVASPVFFGIDVGRRTDVYLPAAIEPLLAGADSRAASPLGHWLLAFARLAPTQTLEQATAALRAWQPVLREATLPPAPPARQHLADPFVVVPADKGISTLRREFARPLFLLLGAVGLVLLVACANLAALVLARFTDRQRELGIRLALGASRGQLVRGLTVEAMVLGVAGAALGVGLALWLAGTVVPSLTTPLDRGIAPHLAVGLDWRLVLAAAGLAVTTGLLAGLAPAWRAARAASFAALASGARGSAGPSGTARTLKGLVGLQIAVSLVLVSAASLLGRSFTELMGQPTAVEGDRVLLASLDGPLFGATPTETLARISALTSRLEAIPGVEAASASTLTPLSGYIMLTPVTVPFFVPDGLPDTAVASNRITPRFLQTFGTPLLAGRDFDERDGPDAPRVAIVNTAFVDHYMPDFDEVVGRVIELRGQPTEIVGVVATGRYMRLRDPRTQFVYLPLAQWLGPQPQPIRFALRSASPDALRGAVVQTVREFDPALTVEFRTLADEIAMGGSHDRLLAWLGGLFAALALLMACLGLYGTFAYLVARRRVEIGVRLALGADRAAILRLVFRDAAMVLAAGLGVGLAGTLATARYLEALLYGVRPGDPLMLAFAVVAVSAVAALATSLPARAAAAIDPAQSIRAE